VKWFLAILSVQQAPEENFSGYCRRFLKNIKNRTKYTNKSLDVVFKDRFLPTT